MSYGTEAVFTKQVAAIAHVCHYYIYQHIFVHKCKSIGINYVRKGYQQWLNGCVESDNFLCGDPRDIEDLPQ